MIAWHAEQLVTDLASATDREQVGILLANEWSTFEADAVVAWLPREPEGQPQCDDLFLGGPYAWTFSISEALESVAAGSVRQWLRRRGFARVICLSVPPHVGVMAVAWRRRAPRATLTAQRIAMLSRVAALRLEVAAATARDASTAAALIEAQRHRATGELASGLVHDFNNCLTTILGFTEMCMTAAEPGGKLEEQLTTIRTAALDAAVVVRRLHSIRLKRKGSEETAVADLCAIAASMPEISRPRWMRKAELSGTPFEVVTALEPVPPVRVVVSEIRELLLNLLFNAFDAMPNGGRVTIATRTIDGDAEISVSDQGIGMSPEVQAHLFQPFFTTKKDSGGSGLGLSVCREIVRRCGGSIDVTSAEGEGSTFRVRLPAALPASADKWRPLPLQATDVPVVEPAAPPRAPQRVLLVDDQEDVRDSVGEMLKALGHDVVSVASGPEALDTARGGAFDVVITDFGMPGMNGAEVATRLHDDLPMLPVVLITGWGLDADTHLPPSVACALGKPITMKALGDAIGACRSTLPTAEGVRVACS